MSKQYIQHNREVTTEQLQKYGKYATHDIHVPILLLYPAGTINDKNGTPVKIDDEFINYTMKATNNAIKKRYKSPLAKVKSFFVDAVENYEIIPIIKNHDTGNVDGVVGHTKGLTYIDTIEGMKCLLINSVVKDPETKTKIEGDLFRNTSLGTRADGSIKEISIVSNEALPHGGFLMSEHTTISSDDADDNILIPAMSKQELLLTEEISQLQLQEHTLDNITIPNHMMLSRMIKLGKIEPWKYEELVQKSPEIIQLMESCLPSNNLGIMHGIKITPTKINNETELDNFINQTVKAYKSQKKGNQKDSDQETEIIKQNYSFEEQRKKELRHILELSAHSTQIAEKYIKIELGEHEEQLKPNDKYLIDYLKQLEDIRLKIKNCQIQLGECKNG